MKTAASTAVVLALFATATASWAQHSGQQHLPVRAAELKWAPFPALPKGAQIAVIEGPPNQAVPFTLRLKFPDGYRIPAHMHPTAERLTVLSGTFHIGMGEKFERSGTQPLRVGDMIILQPGMPHFAWTEAETVVQLHGTGPSGIKYVNAAEDPRAP